MQHNRPARRRFTNHRLADLFVLLLLAAGVVVYCYDAVRASTDILNLIVVVPLTVVVLMLCLIQFVVSITDERASGEAEGAAADVLPVICLFAGYVLSLQWLGFDVGTCLFLVAFLWLHGERRWPWLLAYSISFAMALSIFFSKMLPYSMPMLVLRSVSG
jgi:putative tricarboxylic transport membrane protein